MHTYISVNAIYTRREIDALIKHRKSGLRTRADATAVEQHQQCIAYSVEEYIEKHANSTDIQEAIEALRNSTISSSSGSSATAASNGYSAASAMQIDSETTDATLAAMRYIVTHHITVLLLACCT
jgi:hypothetical protein